MYHSFSDESKRDSYLLVAALIRPAHLATARRAIGSMVMPGQRRIHFYSERGSRKGQIMGVLAELPLQVVLYETKAKIHETLARNKCLTALIRDHIARDVRRLVLERDESQVESDRKLVRQELERGCASDRLTYEHIRAHEEALLAIPDAIAWCWAKGGHWRVKAKQLVTDIHQA